MTDFELTLTELVFNKYIDNVKQHSDSSQDEHISDLEKAKNNVLSALKKQQTQSDMIDKIRTEIVDIARRTMNDNRAGGMWTCKDIIDKHTNNTTDFDMILIPKNATIGDALESIFPQINFGTLAQDDLIVNRDYWGNDDVAFYIPIELWNKPYERKTKNDK